MCHFHFETSLVATTLRPVNLKWLEMLFTHQHGIIDLLLAEIHRLNNFSLFFFIISLLSLSFHLVSPFLSLPLHHHHRCSSSSSVFIFIVIGIPLYHHRCSHRYFLFVLFLLFHPLFIHLLILNNTLLVRCLQSEQNDYQKFHFSCAIAKFA